jgi:hypothetical protein
MFNQLIPFLIVCCTALTCRADYLLIENKCESHLRLATLYLHSRSENQLDSFFLGSIKQNDSLLLTLTKSKKYDFHALVGFAHLHEQSFRTIPTGDAEVAPPFPLDGEFFRCTIHSDMTASISKINANEFKWVGKLRWPIENVSLSGLIHNPDVERLLPQSLAEGEKLLERLRSGWEVALPKTVESFTFDQFDRYQYGYKVGWYSAVLSEIDKGNWVLDSLYAEFGDSRNDALSDSTRTSLLRALESGFTDGRSSGLKRLGR